jgi:hypothetical protein
LKIKDKNDEEICEIKAKHAYAMEECSGDTRNLVSATI